MKLEVITQNGLARESISYELIYYQTSANQCRHKHIVITVIFNMLVAYASSDEDEEEEIKPTKPAKVR